MNTAISITPPETLTFDNLLGYWDLNDSKYLLRKSFGLMLNAAASDREPGHAQMVLDTVHIILEEMNLGLKPVLCCILKNVAEKGILSPDNIAHEFGETVRIFIEGIQKLEQLDTSKYDTNQENFIGLLVTLFDDIRVLLIRLAMRLYDIRHLENYSLDKQCIIVGESRMLYLPIAQRLGLYQIKRELEDLVMRYINFPVYQQIERKLYETKANRDQYTADFISPIAQRLAENGLDCEIKSRVKSIPSIYRKMTTQKVDFEKVYDIFAIRIILNKTNENETADCWKIYSIATDIYSPNPNRLRDWISFPKQNGYESLHTTVKGQEGRWVEIQIRSRRMDDFAEKGYAAHWKYKSDGKEIIEADLFTGLREILAHPAGVSLEKLITREKMALYTDDIFVFTPEGDLKKLRLGYTVSDLAKEIINETGLTCTGAIVNGKMVPLKHTLANGDTVKLLTLKNRKPHKDQLEILKRTWNLTRLKKALKIEAVRETISGIHAESISNIKAGKEDFVIIDPTVKSLHYQFARCCDPTPGNSIFAFVSITQGIKIHRTSCANTHQLIKKYPYRVLEARWKENEKSH
jgi:GTP pyrophosphokinase